MAHWPRSKKFVWCSRLGPGFFKYGPKGNASSGFFLREILSEGGTTTKAPMDRKPKGKSVKNVMSGPVVWKEGVSIEITDFDFHPFFDLTMIKLQPSM